MEVRQYLLLFKKWLWLLILGVAIGGGGAYIFGSYQPVVYQTATRVMVSQAQDQESQNYYVYYDIQLAQTYTQIINTEPILRKLSETLGYPVRKSQITVKQVPNSQLVELTVTDGDAARAAEIANTLVSVFIEYNKNLQNDRYQSIEENLMAQIAQVEGQISTLQGEMTQASASTLETQRQQLQEQARQIEQMMANADNEVIAIESQLETFIPTPAVTNTPAPSWIIPTATPVPVATPTLSAAEQTKYKELQIRRDQLNQMRSLFQQAYGNLLVLQQNSNSDPALRQSQIQTTLALYQQIYSGLLTNYENVRLARLRSTPNVVQIEPAAVPAAPIQPQPLRNGMVGAASGLLIMGAIAFLIEYLDDTLKTPEDVHHYMQLPVLGLIGKMNGRAHIHGKEKDSVPEPGFYVLENPLSPITEGFRTLRANLEFASVDKPLKLIEITSPSPSEGKSTIAANLAAVIAQGGRKVLLLDADFRRPYIHNIVGVPNTKGLADLFRDPGLLPEVVHEIEGTSIQVITTGKMPPNPSELLASERMGQILAELREMADVVVIDTPPVILSDAVILSAKVDGVLVVVRPGGTRIGAAQVMMEQLKRSGARVFGAVLNPISPRNSHYYTKYSYYSSYYYKSSSYGEPSSNGKASKNGAAHKHSANGKHGANGTNGKLAKEAIEAIKEKLG